MVYAIADLHGDYELWKAIKEYLQPEDTLFVLGDSIDRGPDGIKILREALFHPQVTYLMGNHEEFMLRWGESGSVSNEALWRYNGGNPTIKAYNKLSEIERKMIYDKICSLPRCHIFRIKDKDIWLCHSGFNIEDMLMGKNIDMLWERDLTDSWDYENLEDAFNIHPEKMYIVHGHTPVDYLAESLGILNFESFVAEEKEIKSHALCYAGGRKIDIDMCTIMSRTAALLNLETFECTYFVKDDDNNVFIREKNVPLEVRKGR